MDSEERAFTFECEDCSLCGILHAPSNAGPRGVLVVVGGPQYRVGSNRQFILLARALAADGIPVLRFDYRGMGDSEGELRTFESIDTDIRSAIDTFFEHAPDLKEVVLWGLCDAASAALFYAHTDPRVTGTVLLNPWARTEEGRAKSYLKHYYLSRFFSAELWRKIFRGKFRLLESLKSLFGMMATAFPEGSGANPGRQNIADVPPPAPPLRERMADGLSKFNGSMLLILSGDDLTAAEFEDMVSGSRRWRKLLKGPRVLTRKLAGANHTFSSREWRIQVSHWTADWIRSW